MDIKIDMCLLEMEINRRRCEYAARTGRYPNSLILWEGYYSLLNIQYIEDKTRGYITKFNGIDVIKCNDFLKIELFEKNINN
ncbi:TPA: hypothetical protein KQG29_002533 [Clostridioides difficile]|nr:hypothetical protein [Clostridioides difficile]